MSLTIQERSRRVGASRREGDAGLRIDFANETKPAPAPEGSRRYQMLDIWRGAICLLVVIEHAGVALWEGSGEATGVDGWMRNALVWVLTLNIGTALFFVISGYCIASSIESSRRKGHSPAQFLIRRLWRIYPTYWVALLGFVVLTLGLDACGLIGLRQHALALELGSPRDLSLAQWLGNLTLTETWRQHVFGGASSVFTRVAWSLCYQEQFYVVCCLVLWLMPGRLFRTLAVVTAVVVVLRMVLADTGRTHYIDGTFLYSWHEFAVGLAVYWRLSAAGTRNRVVSRIVDATLASFVVVGLMYDYRSTTVAGLFGLLLIGCYRWDSLAGRQRWLEPLRVCGRRSFSIYLAHLPVTVVGNRLLFDLGLQGYWTRALVLVPLSTVAAVAVGWAFYHFIERHFVGAPPSLSTRTRPSGLDVVPVAQPIPVTVTVRAA